MGEIEDCEKRSVFFQMRSLLIVDCYKMKLLCSQMLLALFEIHVVVYQGQFHSVGINQVHKPLGQK